MAFIFIGQVNVLAPIVTINFMLTYSVIDYCYFCVVKSYQLQVQQGKMPMKRLSSRRTLVSSSHPSYGSKGAIGEPVNGTLLEFNKDMNQIFPMAGTDGVEEQKVSIPVSKARGRKSKIPAKETLMNSFGLDLNSNAQLDKGKDEKEPEQTIGFDDDTGSQMGLMEFDLTRVDKRKQSLPNSGSLEQLPRENIDRNGKYMTRFNALVKRLQSVKNLSFTGPEPSLEGSEIKPIQGSVYERFCNHWVSLIGVSLEKSIYNNSLHL